MSKLPAHFAYLRQAPLLVRVGLDLLGTRELDGSANNPIILSWADEVATAVDTPYADWAGDFYNGDSIPWCGLFVAVCAVRSAQGRPERLPTHRYLGALNWRDWGVPVTGEVWVGDVATQARKGGGHVYIIVGENSTHYFGLGGNQNNRVSIAPFRKADVVAIRRPPYRVIPEGAKRVIVNASAGGPVSMA